MAAVSKDPAALQKGFAGPAAPRDSLRELATDIQVDIWLQAPADLWNLALSVWGRTGGRHHAASNASRLLVCALAADAVQATRPK